MEQVKFILYYTQIMCLGFHEKNCINLLNLTFNESCLNTTKGNKKKKQQRIGNGN